MTGPPHRLIALIGLPYSQKSDILGTVLTVRKSPNRLAVDVQS